jgi:hypothetical protein
LPEQDGDFAAMVVHRFTYGGGDPLRVGCARGVDGDERVTLA